MGRTLYLEDLRVGQQFQSSSRRIEASDISGFASLSGDGNRLHTDEEYARAQGYDRLLAHGALVLSIATGLRHELGVFDGSMIALLELRSWSFHRPVFAGDTVSATTTIAEVRPTSGPGRGVVVQGIDVFGNGELVQSGEIVSLVASRNRV